MPNASATRPIRTSCDDKPPVRASGSDCVTGAGFVTSAAPTPDPAVVVVIVVSQPGTIATVWSDVAVSGGALESLTCNVKANEPCCVGVPVKVPSEAMVTPGGSDPVATSQVTGSTGGTNAPSALIVPPSIAGAFAEYVTHSAPLGNGVQSTWIAPTMLWFQPLNVLQISVASEEPSAVCRVPSPTRATSGPALSTKTPNPVGSGASGDVLPI